MAITKSEIRNKVLSYSRVVKEKYPVKKVVLYGSHAYGKPHEDSDIDVAIIIDLPLKTDRIKIAADLFHLTRQIDVRIEPKLVFYRDYLNPLHGSILQDILKRGKAITD